MYFVRDLLYRVRVPGTHIILYTRTVSFTQYFKMTMKKMLVGWNFHKKIVYRTRYRSKCIGYSAQQ